MKKFKKIVLLDFDGVIHSYTSGWKGATTIVDPPVPDMLKWMVSFMSSNCDIPESISCMSPPGDWELCIYSSRSQQFGGKRAMKNWLIKHGMDPAWVRMIKFPTKKPATFITIDDRAICFEGKVDGLTDKIKTFKPWNKS